MPYAPRGARRVRIWLAGTLTVGVLAALAVVVPGPGAAATPWGGSPTAASTAGSGRYLVLLDRAPAASYRGRVPRLARTAPAAGQRYDARSQPARHYTAVLRARQDRVARSVGAQVFYHYTVSLNGFAAALSIQQARVLAEQPGVVAVVPDRVRNLDTTRRTTSRLLGLSRPSGMWRRLGGRGIAEGAGRGTVIGIVDAGIDSDSDSFAAVGSAVPVSYSGSCRHGADDDPAASFACNDKLIGGRYFVEGQGGAGAVWEQEFLSPEDYNGHGSHIASIAAGNPRPAAGSTGGVRLGAVSGMAPAAKLASYKACWTSEDLTDSCMTSDLVAAVDRAVGDGVDILSYSVSGTLGDAVDPVELAFLFAADAGVFVATPAGNSGPARGTVAHPSPWVTTVAASTRDATESADHPTATILAHTGRLSQRPPALGVHSSRGPAGAAAGDVLKPDLTAPGVDVLGAVAPEGNGGRRYDLSSGTSMSAAHVAGLAALVMQAHPDWSPMAVKSAMMTTARNLTDTTSPFDQGAGFVQPRRMLDPGLVLDSGFGEWSGYLAGLGDHVAFPARPVAASQVNLPSIALDELAGRERVQRTVTNVDDSTSTYAVAVHGFEGISVTAVPSVFTLTPGRSQTFTLRVVRDSAELGAYQAGVVRIGDSTGGHRVRLPMVVRPVGVRAPAQVGLPETATRISTLAGVDATMVAKVRGPVAGVDTAGTGSDTSGADFDPGLAGLWSQTIEVGGPAELVRVQALPGDPADDLDLFVLDHAGERVGTSATGKGTETVTMHGLRAGTYTVYVQPWFVADPDGESAFTVRTFQVPRHPVGDVAVTPRRQEAVSAGDDRWRLDTGRLRPAKSYLGWVGWYRDNRADDELVGRTLVSVD